MKLTKLLAQRGALLQQVRLANLAFAYDQLADFAGRISRAQLGGKVELKPADPGTGLGWATLTALEGSQSVIEEHFTDSDLMVLADIIVYLTGQENPVFTFHLENLPEEFLAPVRRELEQNGVRIDRGLLLAG